MKITVDKVGVARSDDGSLVEQQRKCIVCGHWSCPLCRDWCDELKWSEDGEDVDECCDGRCTYVPELPQ